MRGFVFGDYTSSTHPLISSNNEQCVTVSPIYNLVILDISLSIACIGITSLIACDRAIYSASVLLKAVSVCSFDARNTGQFAKHITYPVQDLTEFGSYDVAFVQLPVKSVST